ncbi:hypothetical protein H181DRAFT_00425 [Streptomyces sp. WMMB 714]|nr:hypothetical protein H181DRAFT_00425 [Streptomyces sp. WMMB 714]
MRWCAQARGRLNGRRQYGGPSAGQGQPENGDEPDVPVRDDDVPRLLRERRAAAASTAGATISRVRVTSGSSPSESRSTGVSCAGTGRRDAAGAGGEGAFATGSRAAGEDGAGAGREGAAGRCTAGDGGVELREGVGSGSGGGGSAGGGGEGSGGGGGVGRGVSGTHAQPASTRTRTPPATTTSSAPGQRPCRVVNSAPASPAWTERCEPPAVACPFTSAGGGG